MVDDRPILVFDSGVGGLSVLGEIRKLLPKASIVYAADNAGYPYGIKSEAEIAARVPALLGRLVERYHPRLVVIACNTASTVALAHVRSALAVPVVGTVPAIKPAALLSKSRVIGLLGTKATVRQPYVDKLIADHAGDCTVLRYGSSELVEMAEAKLRGHRPDMPTMQAVMDRLYDQPRGHDIDTVVLSCTHFPLLADDIIAASPPCVTMVDSGQGIARRTEFLTKGQAWPQAFSGRAVFTGNDDTIAALLPALIGYGLQDVEFL